MIFSFGLVIVGLVLLYFGGEWLVNGAMAAARKAGLSPFIIAMTVVGFGTSMPELLVSVQAGLAGQPGIALGNIVGSNISNILLIGGLGALIAPILMAKTPDLTRDSLVMLAAALLIAALMQTGTISRLAGFGFIVLMIAYLAFVIITGRKNHVDDTLEEAPLRLHWGLYIIAGFAFLFAGADMLVRGAVDIARELGVREAVIGLTVVAVGTSLPELATTVSASLKKQSHIAMGNIIGSNIFNVLAIAGISATIVPLQAGPLIAGPSAAIMVGATVLLAGMLIAGLRMGRVFGVALLVGFAGYCVWLFQTGAV